MEEFQRRYKGEERTFRVYTPEEASEEGIDYVHPWTDGHAGDWVLTDDGYVVQILERKDKEKNGNVSTYYKLTCAECKKWWTKRDGWRQTQLRWEIRKQNRSWSSFSEMSWQEKNSRRKAVKSAIDLYVDLTIAKKGRLTDEDYASCGVIYRQDQEIPGASFKRLLRNPYVQEKVMQAMRDKLIEKGITRDSIVDMFMETYSKALEEGHTATMRGITKDLLEIFDNSPDPNTNREEELDPSLLLNAPATEEAEWQFHDTPSALHA